MELLHSQTYDYVETCRNNTISSVVSCTRLSLPAEWGEFSATHTIAYDCTGDVSCSEDNRQNVNSQTCWLLCAEYRFLFWHSLIESVQNPVSFVQLMFWRKLRNEQIKKSILMSRLIELMRFGWIDWMSFKIITFLAFFNHKQTKRVCAVVQRHISITHLNISLFDHKGNEVLTPTSATQPDPV